jgi:hypothetical protein
MGRFADGKFDLVVIAAFTLDAQTKAQWLNKFILASRALFDATEGQLQFGTIHMCDDNLGLGAAEVILHPFNGRAFATIGGFGIPGQAMHLFADSDETTILHEFAHHAFALYDEYTAAVLTDNIDVNAPEPDAYNDDPPRFNEVPLVDSEHPSDELEFASAIIRFNDQLRTSFVQTHTPTLLTCFGDFGLNPMTSSRGFVAYQRTDGIRCATDLNAIHSIMDETNAQVTEFCTAANHNLDRDNDPARANYHSTAYGGLSCWEVMRDKMLERYGFPLEIPELEAAGGPTTTEFPIGVDLAKEGRFVLVMDRSGSMADDGKIVGARYGVEVWLLAMAQLGDFLSVIWYDEDRDVRLALSEVTNVANLQDLIDETNDVGARGFTNIRDALFEAHQQITSRPNRAAIQGVVLLTDGIHNRPLDTSALEVVPTFQADGIPILGIALGEADNVDFETLEALCDQTGGAAQAVAGFPGYDPADEDSIRGVTGVLVGFAHALLRNGLAIFGDLEISGEDRVAALARRTGKPVTKLRNLANALGLKDAADLLRRSRLPGAHVVKFHVEAGAEYTLFTVVYPQKQRLELMLVDPEGIAVEFDGAERILIESASPLKIAIVRNPKPAIWQAVLVRRPNGAAFKAFFYAQVENRRIAVDGRVNPLVPIGQAAVIRASATWEDRLSDLNVTAHVRDPGGGVHTVALSDQQPAEPNSGDYVGTFLPVQPGRHSIELTIASGGNATVAGSLHRFMHGPAPDKKKSEAIDISSAVPAFVRRVPLYFDVGKRPLPVDDDDRFGSSPRFPVKPRKMKLKPLDIERVLEMATQGKVKKATRKRRKKRKKK